MIGAFQEVSRGQGPLQNSHTNQIQKYARNDLKDFDHWITFKEYLNTVSAANTHKEEKTKENNN